MIRFRQSAIAAAGWARRLALLLIAVVAIFPALSLAAAAHGYDLAPAGSHADHAMHITGAMDHANVPTSHHPEHHDPQVSTAADTTSHAGGASGHHAGYDRNCCDACQIAAGLIVAATAPAASPRVVRIARLSEAVPPGEPVSALPEPPRT